MWWCWCQKKETGSFSFPFLSETRKTKKSFGGEGCVKLPAIEKGFPPLIKTGGGGGREGGTNSERGVGWVVCVCVGGAVGGRVRREGERG